MGSVLYFIVQDNVDNKNVDNGVSGQWQWTMVDNVDNGVGQWGQFFTL
jgi:hypothetical protein